MLGRGARMAARTVYDAVDAASSPSSSYPARPQAPPPRRQTQPNSAEATRSSLQDSVRAVSKVRDSARAARQGVLAPVKRASRAVSLEIAGSFFALFALSFSAAAWRFRDSAGASGQRLWIYLAFAALFGYFAVSSFLRARRISRS